MLGCGGGRGDVGRGMRGGVGEIKVDIRKGERGYVGKCVRGLI